MKGYNNKIIMGRNKVYKNESDRHDAEKLRKRNWYRRNADKINKVRMEKYYAKKNDN